MHASSTGQADQATPRAENIFSLTVGLLLIAYLRLQILLADPLGRIIVAIRENTDAGESWLPTCASEAMRSSWSGALIWPVRPAVRQLGVVSRPCSACR